MRQCKGENTLALVPNLPKTFGYLIMDSKIRYLYIGVLIVLLYHTNFRTSEK